MGESLSFPTMVAEFIMQKASFGFGDVINQFPPKLHPYVMAVMQAIHDSYINEFSEDDRRLYENVVSRTVMEIRPSSMDPRRKEDDNAD